MALSQPKRFSGLFSNQSNNYTRNEGKHLKSPQNKPKKFFTYSIQYYILDYSKGKRREEPTMTKTFEKCNVSIVVRRTTERAAVLATDRREIVTRNIWVGDNDKKYVQHKGQFHELSKSHCCTHEYLMW